jgi:NAD+ synthase
MTKRLRIALAPLNPHLGALEKNAARILAARAEAGAAGAELVLTPEFSLTGAPLRDLALDPAFLAACEAALAGLAEATADGGPGLVVGAPWADGQKLYDAAFLLDGGRIAARRARHELPARSAMEEARLFAPGPAPGPVAFRGTRLGLMLGEDAASAEVAETLQESGAEILLALGASPFEAKAEDRHLAMAVARVVETGLPLLQLNLLGGQDGLLTGGGGFAMNADRSLAARLPEFSPALVVTVWQRGPAGWTCVPQALPPPEPEPARLYRALMLGLRDQVEKNGFDGVALAPAGGIAPALVAVLAEDALGPGQVREPGAAGALLLSGADKTGMALGLVSPLGDFSPLGDVWRSTALALARWRNVERPPGALGPAGPVIQEETLAGASLVEHGLPPEALDPLLQALLEGKEVSADHAHLRRRLHQAERQRRRAPPLLKVTAHAFGHDRRYPMTNGFAGLIA